MAGATGFPNLWEMDLLAPNRVFQFTMQHFLEIPR